ncbi:NADH-quinone oxidoreductase subunit C [candidate division KSB1 bacterium]|nr:NADH-quinone oxidoreductase subunit C [candidate division KSB1 bacterium]
MTDKFPEQIAIEKKLPHAVYDWHAQHGDRTLIIDGTHLLSIATLLKEQLGYNFLVDLTAVDYLPRKPRFEVVYHFMNLETKARLRLKIQSDEQVPTVPSLTSLWPIANWYERECWDLFGVKFEGHPNLKRIMLYEEFKGHPLRKDYPKTKRQPLIGPEN